MHHDPNLGVAKEPHAEGRDGAPAIRSSRIFYPDLRILGDKRFREVAAEEAGRRLDVLTPREFCQRNVRRPETLGVTCSIGIEGHINRGQQWQFAFIGVYGTHDFCSNTQQSLNNAYAGFNHSVDRVRCL